MDRMTKFERLKAAIAGKEVDRVPVALWRHFSVVDQDPVSLAEAQYNDAVKYDYDFIKLMPFGLYSIQPWGAQIRFTCKVNQPPEVTEYGIKAVSDWKNIDKVPAYFGSYGKQIELARHVSRLSKGSVPFIQTLFSPLTSARKLAGDRVFADMRSEPEIIKAALQAITDTTLDFIRENINAGVSGFFLATQCCNKDQISEEEYHEFEEPYMLQMINSFKDETFLNIGHLHGDNGMFEDFAALPFTAINWHDRWTWPSLGEARKLTDKCLVGGMREIPYYDKTGKKIKESPLMSENVIEITEHIHESISAVNGRGLIIAPGCCVDQSISEMSQFAIRAAVEP